jgi:hypothetical protein
MKYLLLDTKDKNKVKKTDKKALMIIKSGFEGCDS